MAWFQTWYSISVSPRYTAEFPVSTKTTAYVTATSVADTTKKATATIAVNPAPPTLSRIVVSPSSASIYVGSAQQFSAAAYDQYGHTMTGISCTFSSSNFSVAIVDSASGLATGESVGTASIVAYSASVTSNSASLTVNAAPPPSPLTLTPLSPNIGLVGMNGDYKSLTIIGTGFISGAVVNFDSDVLTPSAVTLTAVTVTIPVAEFSTARQTPVRPPRRACPSTSSTKGSCRSLSTTGTIPPTARACPSSMLPGSSAPSIPSRPWSGTPLTAM